jgi:hypothetical protein
MSSQAQQPCINISALPDITQTELNFYDSSFFQAGDGTRSLPTPEEVMQRPKSGMGRGIRRFEELSLAVEYGQADYLGFEEAVTLRALRQICPPDELPLPEVLGWRKHGENNFIYMSLAERETLREAWPSMTEKDKESILEGV